MDIDTRHDCDTELNVESDNNDIITIHLYDTDALSWSFVEEIDKTGYILEVDNIRDAEPDINFNNNKSGSSTVEVDVITYTRNDTHKDVDGVDDQSSNTDNVEVPITEATSRSNKRFKDTDSWQKEIRKQRRQSGGFYVSSRGKHLARKESKIPKDCKGHI